MAVSICRILDRENTGYDCEKCTTEWTNQGRCCVFFDTDQREDRCCVFTRVSSSSPDYCDCGVANEATMKSPMTVRRLQSKRIIRWALLLQTIIFCLIGSVALLDPKRIVFNVVIDDEYREHFGITTHNPTGADLQSAKSAHNDDDNAEEAPIFSNILKKFFSSPDTTEEEKIVVLEKLEDTRQQMAILHPEQVALTTPTQLYGAAMIYFAFKSMLIRAYPFDLYPSTTTDHLVWFACNLVGMVVAAPGRGEGMASTSFVTIILVINGGFLVVWLYIRKKIDDIILLSPTEERTRALGLKSTGITNSSEEDNHEESLTDH